ncbi:MAG: tetratricopeptide repeat protein [Nitrospina sp.]|nr:MAG: tetratricopeptide repeat protein [Nitrospina sp.]
MRIPTLALVVALWIYGFTPHALATADSALKEALELDRQDFIAESIPFWQQFLQTRPEQKLHIYAQIKMSIAYAKTGNFGDAVQSAKALAETYSGHYDVQFNLGNMLSATQQFDGAVKAYRKATTMRPDEGLAHVGYGLSLFGDQKPDEAVSALRKVRKLFKVQKNISWYQHVRIMIGQIKGFARFPPDFSRLWLANNLKKVREFYESSVFKVYEKQLSL